jgi:hypothetical protein
LTGLALAVSAAPLVKMVTAANSPVSELRVSLQTFTATALPAVIRSSAASRMKPRSSLAWSSVHAAPTWRRTKSS